MIGFSDGSQFPDEVSIFLSPESSNREAQSAARMSSSAPGEPAGEFKSQDGSKQPPEEKGSLYGIMNLKDVVDLTSQMGKHMDYSGFRRSANVDDETDQGFLTPYIQHAIANVKEGYSDLVTHPFETSDSYEARKHPLPDQTNDPLAKAAGYNDIDSVLDREKDLPLHRYNKPIKPIEK